MGNVTVLHDESAGANGIRECYVEKHPDAERWLPENQDAPHQAYWARFDPQSVYFVGGFGDEHYIGSIPLPLYQEALPAAILHSSGNLASRLRVQRDVK